MVAQYPQDEGVLETLTTEPLDSDLGADLVAAQEKINAVANMVTDIVTEPLRRLFDEPTFDAEAAWHDVMRKSETVESARTAYELAKSDAADAKKTLDTRQKALEDLIKELRWKEQRADQAKREPKLTTVSDEEATDGVEGVGGVPTEVDDLGNPWPEDLGSATGEGDEGELGASADAGGDDEAAAG